MHNSSFYDSSDFISDYIHAVSEKSKISEAREHAYRPLLEHLLKQILPEHTVINDPARVGKNAPDFLIKKGDVPVGYIECKDIGIDLDDKEVQSQVKRYLEAFDTLVLTNYLTFRFYKNGEKYEEVSTEYYDGIHNIQRLADLLSDFVELAPRTIKSAKQLAEIMAKKSRVMRDVVIGILNDGEKSEVHDQFQAFQQVLIHDLSIEDFADMYSQTLTYGLFVARYFDESLSDFSRYEAQDLLPHANPLLRNFFGHIAGINFEPRLAWVIDDLVEAYKAADVSGLMHKEFTSRQKDPVLHFYETYLSEYNPKLRKSRGVYYTPEEVVSFIVRSVDEILKQKFDLPEGLADRSKMIWKFKSQELDRRTKDRVKKTEQEIHRVNILDPAVGTGTFLNTVIQEIRSRFEGQEGQWSSFVAEHLLPRLFGFELMMASYTMAHLKLGITLKESGYEGKDKRLGVYLTNSLEEGVKEVPNLFMSQWLTQESIDASKVKNDLPIMVVLGNPPYSVSSSNKSEWITNLLKEYKKDLKEKNIQPLSDDYIKFIRLAEHQIERTGNGIVAMITNNSFLDGLIHRQMRKHLMQTFDEIYILNLHGNSKKKETTPTGGKDENVFDIQQGVGISFFIKSNQKKKNELARIKYADLYGLRLDKYDFLTKNSLNTVDWKLLDLSQPNYFFVDKDFSEKSDYDLGIAINKLFTQSSSGIKTHRDHFVIDMNKDELQKRIQIFKDIKNTDDQIASLYSLKDNRDWSFKDSRKKELNNMTASYERISYKPWDFRWIYFSKFLIDFDRRKLMSNMVGKKNVGISLMRKQVSSSAFSTVLCVNTLMDINFWGFQSYIFPLYHYPDSDLLDEQPQPNLYEDKVKKIEAELKMKLDWNADIEKSYRQEASSTFSPVDLLDYIYAVLHSPNYREKYKEFLKIDFPRIPFDVTQEQFWQLVKIGGELRQLHLLEHPMLNEKITTFPIGGSNIIEKKFPIYEGGKVKINESQYFGNVPEEAWNFWIGGYQPAQKWLKDRRERQLSLDDLEHYQKMIGALVETGKVMSQIDLSITL